MGKTFWDCIAGAHDLAERLNARGMYRMVGTIQRTVPKDAAVLECGAYDVLDNAGTLSH